MKISRMIELLKKVQENHGDCEVFGYWDDGNAENALKVTRVTYTDVPIECSYTKIDENSCVLKLKEN